MSSLVDEPAQAETAEDAGASQLPDASVLEDKTPIWFRSTPGSALFVLTIGAVFAVMANRPLWHTDLWDHINYGEHIVSHQSISSTEPLLPLCQGMPMINIPWLAQAGMVFLKDTAGLASLQFVYALLIAGSLATIAWRATKNAASMFAGLLAAAIFFILNYYQFMIIRPQLLGVLFFSIVAAWSHAANRVSRLSWTGLPLMFAVWANCHGSFAIGLLIMGLTCAGRAGDVWLRSKSLKLAIADPQVSQIFLIIQLCSAAVLLNPAGLAVYTEVLGMASNSNVDSMFEWNALTLRMKQGQWAAGMLLLLLVSIRLTPRRVRLTEMLPLIATGLLTFWSARMINWWAPLMALVTATHLSAALRSIRKVQRRSEAVPASGLWTVVNLGLCWILFAFTGFGVQVVHGKAPEISRMVSKQTPLQLVKWLNSKEQLPQGISFVPAEWAGFVMYAGPVSIRPMVNLHVHVIPVDVWTDYLRLMNGPSDWEPLLDQYGINLVVADREQQPGLVRRLSESDAWTARYQDNQAIVFSRNKPI